MPFSPIALARTVRAVLEKYESQGGEASEMKEIRLLLVDDHPVVREGIRRLLELDERVAVVREAGSGEEALEQMEVSPADVALMDIRLPGIDGIEATRRLLSRYPDLKVIVLSSFGDEFLVEAIEAGAKGYMLKTATQPELVHAVVQAAGGQTPIDPQLTPKLVGRLAELSRMSPCPGLSGRQQEMLRLIAEGVPSKELAGSLSISPATLTRELRHVYDVLGVNGRAHAVAEAYKKGLL